MRDAADLPSEKKTRLLNRRGSLWPPLRGDNLFDARNKWAEPLWERYRRRILDAGRVPLKAEKGELQAERNKLSREHVKMQAEWDGRHWGLGLLERLVESHGTEATGPKLAALYGPGRSEALGEEWRVHHTFPAFIVPEGKTLGEIITEDDSPPNGVAFYLDPKGEKGYAGNLMESTVRIDGQMKLGTTYEHAIREYRQIRAAKAANDRRQSALECEVHLIDAVLDEYSMEGDVFTWHIVGEPTSSEVGTAPNARGGKRPDWLDLAEARANSDWGPLVPFLDLADEELPRASQKELAAHFAVVCMRYEDAREYCNKRQIDPARIPLSQLSRYKKQAMIFRGRRTG